jgi:hypothetical protein
VFERYPELESLPADEQSRIIYEKAFALIQNDPGRLVKGALYNWSMLFSDSWYSVYSFVGGEKRVMRNIAQWVVLALCGLGLIRWFRRRDDPLTSLVGVSVLGILISVPFLPPTDAYRMRPYAVSMIVFGLLPALGLLFGMERLKIPSTNRSDAGHPNPSALVVLTCLLVSIALLGPLLLKGFGHPPRFDPVSCAQGSDRISIRFDPGAHFNILREKQPGLDWMPDFHIGRFRQNAHSLPDVHMIAWAEELDPLTSVFYTLDYGSSQKVLVVSPTRLLPAPNSLWQACGQWEEDPLLKTYNIFYARETASIP